MTMPTPDQLDRELAELTKYRGPSVDLLTLAFAQADRGAAPRSILERLGRRPLSGGLLAACVAVVCLAGLSALMFPALSSVRSVAPSAPVDQERARSIESLGAGVNDRSGESQYKSSYRQAAAGGEERFVARKATIEFTTPDVRAAFSKAAHLVSEAAGEYVENSTLTGDGPKAQATLTLRIGADRLGAVLIDLRALGTVKSENTSGEDVTTQVVDVEARLRNEQRVEAELLELLDKRTDAPLKDVLELRSSLSSVRQSIEQLTGQRERLGRLVSLASVLVVIRASDEPAKPAAASIADYFSSQIARAWSGGLRFLADTLANLVGLFIGGLPWWLLAAAAAFAVHRYNRRLAARCV